MSAQKITTFLWFEDKAEEAARFYVSVFGGDSRIVETTRYPEAVPHQGGTVMTVTFELAGQRYTALNGGKQDWSFSEAISLSVDCDDQEEVDDLWAKLTAGGEPGPCGWLKDKYGLSWQIVPRYLSERISAAEDRAAVNRMVDAMMKMGKLDVAALKAAYEGK